MLIGKRVGDEEDPLDPVNSVFSLSVEKVCQCLPEGRLDVVEVGEKGERGANGADGSGMYKGGDLDKRWIGNKLG